VKDENMNVEYTVYEKYYLTRSEKWDWRGWYVGTMRCTRNLTRHISGLCHLTSQNRKRILHFHHPKHTPVPTSETNSFVLPSTSCKVSIHQFQPLKRIHLCYQALPGKYFQILDVYRTHSFAILFRLTA
jgi:hypothetical protein